MADIDHSMLAVQPSHGVCGADATSGSEWDDGDTSPIDEPVFINEPVDLPARVIDQVHRLVPSIGTPDDDPDSGLRNRCSHCEAVLDDWHLCEVGGPLRAEDGAPMPCTTAPVLDGTPFALTDCGIYRAEIQAVLDTERKAD